MRVLVLVLAIALIQSLLVLSVSAAANPLSVAEENGKRTQEIVKFCNRFCQGWLSHADPVSGLIPRNLKKDAFWNARDSAADNYPFIVLTAYITDQHYLKLVSLDNLETEKRLTSRVDSLPDDFLFETQGFRTEEIDREKIIFGASEYAKDGLMPITEWIGPSPWLDRMTGLVLDIWKHAKIETEAGLLPSRNIEVNGEMLQTMSRLYWMTGEDRYKQWCYRLCDYYLLENDFLDVKTIALRDHGCEIIGGLSEAYVIAASQDPEKGEAYRAPLHAILDVSLEKGTNEDGLMYVRFNPKTGEHTEELSDNFGYVYNAFLTVAEVDGVDRYRKAAQHALDNVYKYLNEGWNGETADGYADAMEGALNLMNRLPSPSAARWIDATARFILNAQDHDGILEGWHGDGNSTRTLWMVALWKTQGATLAPWREDIRFGAALGEDGTLHVSVDTGWPYDGALRLDRPRSRDYLKGPFDYPRINQFPEWFTVDAETEYTLKRDDGSPETVTGEDLHSYRFKLEKDGKTHFEIRKKDAPRTARITRPPVSPIRALGYRSVDKKASRLWEKNTRGELARILFIDDLLESKDSIPLDAKETKREDRGAYTWVEFEIRSTLGRTIPLVATFPKHIPEGGAPAVVCVHGHGGNRYKVYDSETVYNGFATSLAERGYVTVAADVEQHGVFEEGRLLMGERLWDLIRCVDFLESRPEVDGNRIGCAGLSLGGEMTMWLGAMDTRIAVTVSCGFLTLMDQMEKRHCMCWKFDGLRELVDYPDIYSLVAPRALQCQNGMKEPYHQFPVAIARYAFEQIEPAYADRGKPENLDLEIHPGGHEVDVQALLGFFGAKLGPQ